jgi:hypothetical protein
MQTSSQSASGIMPPVIHTPIISPARQRELAFRREQIRTAIIRDRRKRGLPALPDEDVERAVDDTLNKSLARDKRIENTPGPKNFCRSRRRHEGNKVAIRDQRG